MNASQRIVLNTATTYTRSVVGAGLMLFSTRWILNALGQTDFGLFTVVGSVIIFITFFNTVLSNSAARFFAYSIGQDDVAEVERWFNVAFMLHLSFAAVLIIIGWPIGEYVIANVLTVPPERLAVCLWVFRISLISAFVSMISIPFIAMFTAKQWIAQLAIWDLLTSVMKFILALLLVRAPGDRLFFYAVGMVSIIVFVRIAQVVWAIVAFVECRIDYHQWFDKRRTKQIFSFAGWTFIGSLGTILRNQGSAILLNLNFGLAANAAYGIANQVSSQTNQLSAAMIGAFSPEIITSEGRGDRVRMLSLAQSASKFGTILVLLFAVSLIIEMEYILKLWLVEPPKHTASLCRLILITFIINKLSVGNMIAMRAFGKIAAYQVTVGGCLILTLPLAWFFIKLGAPPNSVGFAFILSMVAVSIGRLFWAQRFFGVPYTQWLKRVFLPCGIVGVAAVMASMLPFCLMPMSFLRLICVLAASISVALLAAWYLALDKTERQFVQESRRSVCNKINRLTIKNRL